MNATMRSRALLALGLAWLAWAAAPVWADPLDARLEREAPDVMHYLQQHGYHSVGVLKFRVQQPFKAPSFNVGTINVSMADRLENALILANDPKHPVNVIDAATANAAGHLRGALHRRSFDFDRSVEDRHSLLALEYPVAWGDGKVRPDAFLTGDILLSKDNRHATVRITAFDRTSPRDTHVVREFTLKTYRSLLAECGQTFVVPRGVRGDDALDDQAAQNATSQDTGTSVTVSKDTNNPVKLTILYNGNDMGAPAPDPLSPGGEAYTATEPTESDEVVFKVQNVGPERVGIVLAINGKSTLMEEDITQRDPADCYKWILEPNAVYAINGFYTQMTGENLKKFRVVDPKTIEDRTALLGEYLGQIDLLVYAQGTAAQKAPGEAEPDKRNLRRGILTGKAKPRTLAEAQSVVARASGAGKAPSRVARLGKRGVIWEEEQKAPGGDLQKVEFSYARQPIVHQKIRYYTRPTGTTSPTEP
jgi:hypothetical protein